MSCTGAEGTQGGSGRTQDVIVSTDLLIPRQGAVHETSLNVRFLGKICLFTYNLLPLTVTLHTASYLLVDCPGWPDHFLHTVSFCCMQLNKIHKNVVFFKQLAEWLAFIVLL